MQLLEDADEDDDDGFEVESEDDQWGSTQGHSDEENLDAELSSDEGSQSDDDESTKGRIAFSNGHQTIKRLQDDLLGDEDEPDDGMFYYNVACSIYLYLAIRFDYP
jgi:hypothetical protein